jgi:hypothetical protein
VSDLPAQAIESTRKSNFGAGVQTRCGAVSLRRLAKPLAYPSLSRDPPPRWRALNNPPWVPTGILRVLQRLRGVNAEWTEVWDAPPSLLDRPRLPASRSPRRLKFPPATYARPYCPLSLRASPDSLAPVHATIAVTGRRYTQSRSMCFLQYKQLARLVLSKLLMCC